MNSDVAFLSESFSCATCSVSFQTQGNQRIHFKSDWHKYNMKRSIADMDSVPLESFSALIEASQEEPIDPSLLVHHCIPCNKKYNSENAYENHVASKKHQSVAKSFTPPTAPSSPNSPSSQEPPAYNTHEYWKYRFEAIENEDTLHALIHEKMAHATPLEPNACLFCPHASASLDASLHHMRLAHSFMLPHADRVLDVPGLLAYLAEKISLGNLCLFCDALGPAFYSLQAVREHMRVKGHCKVAWEREEDRDELEEFYDWEEGFGVDEGAIVALQGRRERALRAMEKGSKSKALVHQSDASSLFLMQNRIKVLALERAKVVQNGFVERKFKRREMNNNLSKHHFEGGR
ncbi:C2H2 type zinc-finger-domain-containing protein [Chytriomyces sp. MP71]|nr:C2H2 type zinc-finger-domain-containing protein [Chytriomyces sp. MP71]